MLKRKVFLLISALLLVVLSCKEKPNIEITGNKIEIGQTTIDNLAYRDAKISTTVTSLGGNNISNHGHCWGIAPNPTITDSKSIKGILSQAGSFSSDLNDLTPNTTYYIRAYLTYQGGTIYGSQMTLSTKQTGKPTVTTKEITDITSYTATSGGEVTQDSGLTVTQRGIVWSTSQNPTTTTNLGKTTDGSGTGSYISELTGLVLNTTYYIRAYATNEKGTSYGEQKQFTTISAFTDARDGKIYKKVTIGSQTWMAENLAYLPSVSPSSAGSATTPYYYVHAYNGTSISSAKATAYYNTFGVLYNWPAAMAGAASSSSNPSGVRGVCPSGWHLPSDAEWTELTNYLIDNGHGYGGSGNDIGKSMASTSGWTSSSSAGDVGNDQATNNSSGFTALPGGGRYGDGSFNNLGISGYWWSSSGSSSSNAWYRDLNYYNATVNRYDYYRESGFSVRCLKD